MGVPFIDLKRYEEDFLHRWNEKIAYMTSRSEFIGGNEVNTLETRLSEFVQVTHTVSCANGTDAIQLALRAIGVGRGDLVLVPNMTFWATFEAVVNVGGSPVTVDIDIADGGIDLAALIEAIAKYKPKAAVIAHLYGWGSANLKFIRECCKENKVLLVEDGAQCFGVEVDGEPIYKDALISTTSFYPAKVLGAAGDGGAVFTNDPDLAAAVRQLGNHGRTTHYGYGAVGWNSRLDALQAAFLNISLDYLPRRLASRREAVDYYKTALATIGIPQMLAPSGYFENGYCNVCLIEDSDIKSKVESALKSAGIGFGNIYPGAMSVQPGAKDYLHAHVGGDQAEKLCRSVINLPLFPYMTPGELAEVTQVVNLNFTGSGDE
jgi:UDP-2-acetamido-2-deoxy-ribo-hexuluronate aminotransferase